MHAATRGVGVTSGRGIWRWSDWRAEEPVLREINDRQWGALFQVLIEAKYKAESMLRNDTVFKEPGQVAFFQGWIVYSDYIISQLEALRSKEVEFHPGPEPGPI